LRPSSSISAISGIQVARAVPAGAVGRHHHHQRAVRAQLLRQRVGRGGVVGDQQEATLAQALARRAVGLGLGLVVQRPERRHRRFVEGVVQRLRLRDERPHALDELADGRPHGLPGAHHEALGARAVGLRDGEDAALQLAPEDLHQVVHRGLGQLTRLVHPRVVVQARGQLQHLARHGVRAGAALQDGDHAVLGGPQARRQAVVRRQQRHRARRGQRVGAQLAQQRRRLLGLLQRAPRRPSRRARWPAPPPRPSRPRLPP
jgi:hypothetical protein